MLLPGDVAQHKEALDVIRRIVLSGGELPTEVRMRLLRIEALFATEEPAPPTKKNAWDIAAARPEPTHETPAEGRPESRTQRRATARSNARS
jgi:hypothetical protein